MLSQSRIDASIRAAFNRGEQKGISKGSKAKSEEIARKMQAAGADPAFIKEMTDVEL